MADEKKIPDRDHKSDMLIEWAPRINRALKSIRNMGIPSSIEDADLHSAGVDGLMDAWHRFDKKRGNFGAFADRRIKGKMLDHAYASGGVNAVDKFFRAKAKSFKAGQSNVPAGTPPPAKPDTTEED